MDFRAVVVELFQYGIGDRAAHAAADYADFVLSGGFRGLAQRSDEILKTVALAHGLEFFRRGSGCLDNNGDSTLFRIIAVDGDRNAFAALVHAQNDELSGLCLFGNQRRLDLIERDGGAQFLFPHDFVHTVPSSPVWICVSFLALRSPEPPDSRRPLPLLYAPLLAARLTIF